MNHETTYLPVPVNPLIAILVDSARNELLQQAIKLIEEVFSPIDYQSPFFPFNVTDYYAEEMGMHLQRLFVSLTELITPDSLPKMKKQTSELENRFREKGNRVVNLDPGYLDFHKIVLASYKEGKYKIYLTDGVWADMTLQYEKGRFYPFSWSFPDFKSGLYSSLFMEIRVRYKKKLKSLTARSQ